MPTETPVLRLNFHTLTRVLLHLALHSSCIKLPIIIVLQFLTLVPAYLGGGEIWSRFVHLGHNHHVASHVKDHAILRHLFAHHVRISALGRGHHPLLSFVIDRHIKVCLRSRNHCTLLSDHLLSHLVRNLLQFMTNNIIELIDHHTWATPRHCWMNLMVKLAAPCADLRWNNQDSSSSRVLLWHQMLSLSALLRDRQLIYLAVRLLLSDLEMDLLGKSRTGVLKLSSWIAWAIPSVFGSRPRPLLYARGSLERAIIFRTLSTLAHQCTVNTLLWLLLLDRWEELRLMWRSIVCFAILASDKALDHWNSVKIVDVYTVSWTRSTSSLAVFTLDKD